MREIDPQSEARLAESLRRLAADAPRSAPAGLGVELAGRFRRHHARRRLMRRGGMLVLIGFVVFAVWMWRSPAQQHSRPESYAKAPNGTIQEKPIVSPAPVVVSGQPQRGRALTPPRSERAAATAANRAFLPLPAYDPGIPTDDLQVVRVQLPASALWKIGAPVPADAGERRVMADFVVGQDGTAYAVRLVQ